jgi:hypothetical protein
MSALALHDDTGTLHGRWRFDLIDADGTIVRTHEQDNLIVTTGKSLALDRTFGLSASTALVGMAVGTNATAAAVGDTAITGPVYKAFDATPTRTGLAVTAITTYATSEANIAIREVGLLTGSGLVLFNRIVTSAITKDVALSLKITVTITQG